MKKLVILTILMILVLFIAGCAEPPTTPPSSTPSIEFTSVSSCGSSEGVSGVVNGVNSADYNVVVYVKVGDLWWGPKPYYAEPLTHITQNGKWACKIVTGGDDAHAKQVSAFLIPKGYSPPNVEGKSVLPWELFSYPNVIAQRCK